MMVRCTVPLFVLFQADYSPLKRQCKADTSPAELYACISVNSPIQHYFQFHLVSEAFI